MPVVHTAVRGCGEGSECFSQAGYGSGRRSIGTIILKDGTSWRPGVQFPLKLVLVLAICVFTVGPAITLWMMSWQAGNTGINSINALGQSSVESVTVALRASTMRSTTRAFLELVQPSEDMILAQSYRLKGSEVLSIPGSTAVLNYSSILATLGLHFDIRSSRFISIIDYALVFQSTVSYPRMKISDLAQFTGYIRMNLDLLHQTHDPTVYIAESTLNDFYNASVLRYYLLDQDSGQRIYTLLEQAIPLEVNPSDITHPEQYFWENELYFNANSGLPEVTLNWFMPSVDLLAAHHISIYTDLYTVSSFLNETLFGPKQRLFVNFRTPTGSMIGASHGKYFSHSDVDYSANNPLTNPPPVAEFRRYTPVNSTDATIRAAGVWLQESFFSWDVIPDVNTVQVLNGEAYWLSAATVSTKMGLRVNLVLVVDRESTMGPIEANTASTLADIRRTNTNMTILLVVVVVAALLCAVLITWLLTVSLSRLAFGMDMLALLRFEEEDGDSLLASPSRFAEVSKCELSFISLERGLRAFVKYVPRDVVRMMLAGEMESTNVMVRRVVSILFMDIAGFSTLCEKILSDQLMRLTQDYLQAMCEIIVRSRGTLDKFIGDCIMALWNAPRQLKHHERAAVGAALDMQARLVELHREWLEDGIPAIKFRVGINTDAVLVGNFGCEHRINYTVLGDGVNLASRLEAANKPFGTVVLVAESTRSSLAANFAFRCVGKITVPGKSEVVAVHEPLFRSMLQPFATISMSSISCPLLNEGTPTLPGDPEVLNAWRMVPKATLEELTRLYEKGMEHYVAGDLSDAEKSFVRATEVAPEDGPTKLLLQLSREGKKPGVRWDGVLRFEHK